MSDSTGLIAISFLGIASFFLVLRIYELANQLAAQMVAGTAGDSPMPMWFRTRMLFQMWLPHQAVAFAVEAILVVVFLEAADLVSNEGVKFVAYLFAFICIVGSVMALMTMTLGLFEYRNRLLRTERE
jgi:hypothetical protein